MDRSVVNLYTLLYTLGVSIVLAIAYSLRSGVVEGLAQKTTKSFSRPKAAAVAYDAQVAGAFDDLRQSPSWWSDKKIFELERRAIFSKVGVPGKTLSKPLMAQDLVIRDPCVQIPEAWRLSNFRDRWILVRCHSRKRQTAPYMPQRMPAQSICCNQERIRQLDSAWV